MVSQVCRSLFFSLSLRGALVSCGWKGYVCRETPDDAEKKCEGIRIIDDLFFQFIDKERI